jgi:hypothetical protein
MYVMTLPYNVNYRIRHPRTRFCDKTCFRNKDVSFLRSEVLKLSWYEYLLLDMLLVAVFTLALSSFLLLKCVGCCSAAARSKKTKVE